MPKIFISATSHDLKLYRLLATDWARREGYEPVVQDEFPVQADYQTIVHMLRDEISF